MASVRDIDIVRRSPELRRLHRWYRWTVRGRKEIRDAAGELRTRQDEFATTIAQALEAAAANDLDSRERAWVDRIEGLRGRLCSSDEELTFTDFGVGAPSEDAGEPDPAARGIVRTRVMRDLCMTSSNSKYADLVMLKLVRALRPASCVEMGTLLGVSGAYQGAALEINDHGRMVTLDGAATLAACAAGHFRELGLHRIETRVGPFESILGDVMRERRPVDFVFADGHHDGDAIVGYFHAMLPHLAPRAVLVFDDITASPDMARGWATIKEHAAVLGAVDVGLAGLCWVRGPA
jgi:predicted O-methyltransferase YrrM